MICLRDLLQPVNTLAALFNTIMAPPMDPDPPLVGNVKRAYLDDEPRMTPYRPSMRCRGAAPCMLWEPEGGDYEAMPKL